MAFWWSSGPTIYLYVSLLVHSGEWVPPTLQENLRAQLFSTVHVLPKVALMLDILLTAVAVKLGHFVSHSRRLKVIYPSFDVSQL